jgi:hypothetical protein
MMVLYDKAHKVFEGPNDGPTQPLTERDACTGHYKIPLALCFAPTSLGLWIQTSNPASVGLV